MKEGKGERGKCFSVAMVTSFGLWIRSRESLTRLQLSRGLEDSSEPPGVEARFLNTLEPAPRRNRRPFRPSRILPQVHSPMKCNSREREWVAWRCSHR